MAVLSPPENESISRKAKREKERKKEKKILDFKDVWAYLGSLLKWIH